MLFEGRTAVAILFGEETPVSLRIQRDPDAGQDCLIVWIQTDLPPTEAVDRLMEFNETWLVDRLDLLGDRLTFLI